MTEKSSNKKEITVAMQAEFGFEVIYKNFMLSLSAAEQAEFTRLYGSGLKGKKAFRQHKLPLIEAGIRKWTKLPRKA